ARQAGQPGSIEPVRPATQRLRLVLVRAGRLSRFGAADVERRAAVFALQTVQGDLRPGEHVSPWVQSSVVPQAPLGMLFPGDPGVTSRLMPADKNNFAPRVGIAWDPIGNGRLGVRAAYGLFVEDDRTDPWIYPAVNQPFVIRKMIFNPVSLSDPYQ